MSHVPHELPEEFPDSHAALHRLKIHNAHFARLAQRHHEVNRAIHRAEAKIEPTSDDTLEAWKKERLRLKDEIAGILAANA